MRMKVGDFQRLLAALEKQLEAQWKLIGMNEKMLEKLEEIRYAVADNETGTSNLLRQMKLTNKRLEELIDKRN